LMRRHLPPLIIRQRQTPLRLDAIEDMTEATQCRSALALSMRNVW
jgi:hypothetical protein